MTEETIFLAALERTTPAERAAYLDQACAGDAALRERVEALLRSHADPDSFLDMPAMARQAEGTDDPLRTTDLPARDEKAAKPGRRKVETAMCEEVLALLAPAREPNSLGRLDHYEMLEVAGRGGMGIVFKARDTKLQRIVAIKVLAPQLAANGTSRKRFVREAQSGAAVRDDHVVGIYAVSEEGSVAYLAMEFIGGVTLEDQIKASGPMEVKEILRIGMQAAEGLAAAHRQGLIHRDVKPANILLENGVQRVKITDFGLARAGDNSRITQSGVIAGTPLYMSPEQTRGEELDPRSDLFSLGSVLYTMCTGEPAFSAGNAVAVLKRVCEDTPRPIRDRNPEIPDWLAAEVDRLMAKEKGERFQAAAELAEVLGQHLARLQQVGRRLPRQTEERERASSVLPEIAKSGLPRRRWKRIGAMALLVGVAASLVIVAIVKRPNSSTPVEPDPRVLTVSKRPEDGGRFRTITEALENVESGMTIQVLDDAIYHESLSINSRERHRGVVLEAAANATISRPPDGRTDTVAIRNVSDFTLRGFRIKGGGERHTQVGIVGFCPGVVLDRLDMKAGHDSYGIQLVDVPLTDKDAPIIIQNCTIRVGSTGVYIEAAARDDRDRAQPCGHVVIRNNTIVECDNGVCLTGAVYKVHLVGNRILHSRFVAIDLFDQLEGATDLLVANNTLLQNQSALRVWDDHRKGKDFLKCKNIRVQNNLVLEPVVVDMMFFDHPRGNSSQPRPGKMQELLNSPEWHFSFNWREINPVVAAKHPRWIPACPNDNLAGRFKVLSRKQDHSDFLRPPRDSPLAKGGAGVSDISLPAYVGAVPPEGVEPWDWQKTWDIQCRRLLTVSKKPEGRGHFRTITEALDKVQEGMTIRVLDDGVYEEQLLINRREQHRGVVLEASGKATIRKPSGTNRAVWIQGVPRLTLRGFRFEGGKEFHALVYIGGPCSGVVLDRLDMTSDYSLVRQILVELYDVRLSDNDAPIVIQNCTMRGGNILLHGANAELFDRPLPCGNVVIRNNTLVGLGDGIVATGAVYKVLVVGNRIVDCKISAIDLFDLLAGAEDILIANNTFLRNENSLRIWDDHEKGNEFLKCKNIRVQSNLMLAPQQRADMRFFDHARGKFERHKPGDVAAMLKSGQWRFSHNWREVYPELAPTTFPGRWIPSCPNDHLEDPIKVLSRTMGDSNFLRPPKDSPLAYSGAGGDTLPAAHVASALAHAAGPVNPWCAAWSLAQTLHQPDRALPAYVGAVPPEGMAAWDWEKTWKRMMR
jgi:serine/threonine protein kinase